jgi:hypothetical protein
VSNTIFVYGDHAGPDLLGILTCIFTGLGIVLLWFYTIYTKRQVTLTQTALEEARNSNAEALAETRRSNKATEESNRIARQSLELGNRAWLVATEIEPYSLAAGPGRYLWVNVENLGRIPASDIILRGFVAIQIGVDSPVGLTSTNLVKSRAIAGPGRGCQGRIHLGDLTEDDVENIRSGEHALLAYCEIEYRDWFQPRKTIACWQYACREGVWTAAPNYNRMD